MDVLFIVVGLLLSVVLVSTYIALSHYEAHKAAINSDVVAEPELITEAVPPDIDPDRAIVQACIDRAKARQKREREKKPTAQDAWEQVILLEDKVATLEMLLTAFRESTNESVTKRLDELDDRIGNLDGQLSFHVERIDDDIHVEDIDVYDWIAARDPEFANRCKVSYRYTPTGRIKREYGPRKDR